MQLVIKIFFKSRQHKDILNKSIVWFIPLAKCILKLYCLHKKLKNRTTIWSSNPTSGYLYKRIEIRILKRLSALPCSLFTIAKIWKQPKCLSADEWINEMCYILTIKYYSVLKKKKGKPDICDNMDRPRGHYAKWNKPDTERQILYGFIYMWNLK